MTLYHSLTDGGTFDWTEVNTEMIDFKLEYLQSNKDKSIKWHTLNCILTYFRLLSAMTAFIDVIFTID